MTAILLRRERGRNNVEIYAVLVVTPPPLFSAKLRFKRGGVTTREYGTIVVNNPWYTIYPNTQPSIIL